MAIIVVWVCEVVKVWLSAVVCCCFTDGRVVKFLVEQNNNNALHGQVTIGTLILQVETFAQFGVVFLLFALGLEFSLTKDCAVGLLFALLPVLGGNSGLLQGMVSMGKLLLVLSIYLTVTSILSWSFVPYFLKLMIQLSSQCSDKLGLNLELGSFIAGVMISSADFAKHTLDQVLFCASDNSST
ncbi:hypothetical protein WN944_006092 [Citrus x changshan-huyou]|uniref:Uncharacterized protein n=1 Tax=Citrus x changshan-huyou TaxID=2935761 RepID=A0AAP0MKN1_9ROSI